MAQLRNAARDRKQTEAIFSNDDPFQNQDLDMLPSKPDKSHQGRQLITIDENEDTIHNGADLNSILERGRRLQNRMNEALGDDAWE